jgi:hypothetical protein
MALSILQSDALVKIPSRNSLRQYGKDVFTKLLIQGKGTDGSTSIIDDAGNTVNVGGDAQIDTAQYVFNNSSILFDGAGDYLEVINFGNIFNFGTGDFTIEYWARFSSIAADCILMDIVRNGVRAYRMEFLTGDGKFHFNTTGVVDYATTTSIAANTWYHFAFCRNSGILKIFVQGIAENTQAYTTDVVGIDILTIGSRQDYAANFPGWMDGIRISNFARYVSNFVVPDKRFN